MTETDQTLYERTEPARLLSDEEWVRLTDLGDQEFDSLDENTKVKLFATAKWHALKRYDATFASEGWRIDDLSFDDVLKEIGRQG